MRFVTACVALLAVPGAAQAIAGSADGGNRQVDAIFAPWSGLATPGCAVGIARDGVMDYTHGYGMANLEHGIPIAPTSVFHT
jgi:CubicO group peptidase (beta-lactamase class C family)